MSSDSAYTPKAAPPSVMLPPSPSCLAESGATCKARMNRRHDWRGLLALSMLGILPWLSACSQQVPPPNRAEATFGSTVDPLDHDPSDTFVRNVYIDGEWVGSAGSGGSGVASGITLPVKWHPGLTRHVRWERCDRFDRNNPVPDSEACKWHELDAPVSRYNEVGMTWVHIMPGDKEVKIIPSMVGPRHPEYPGPSYPTKDFSKRTRDADPLRNGKSEVNKNVQ